MRTGPAEGAGFEPAVRVNGVASWSGLATSSMRSWRFRGHRSEHLADITWDAHVRATAGAECRKRIP
jgi:hypothetical protein